MAVIDTNGLKMLILHADCLADAETLRKQIKERFPDVGQIAIGILGVTIGAHCGPGLLTVFYSCEGKKSIRYLNIDLMQYFPPFCVYIGKESSKLSGAGRRKQYAR